MTISSIISRNGYVGNGVTTVYAYSFRILDAFDLLVTQRDTLGIETTLAYPAAYSVSGVGRSSGGSVTLATALASGYSLSIRRVVDITQETDIRNQGSYFPETIETALDKLTMVDQQHEDDIGRSVTLPETVDPLIVSAVLPVPSASTVLSWNAGGTALENRIIDFTGVALPGAGRTVATLTAYLANNAVFNILDFGAAPGGATNATTQIQAALDAAGVAGGGRVIVPAGLNFRVIQGGSGYAVRINYSNVWLEFEPGAVFTMDTAASAGSCIQVNTVGATTALSNVRVTNAKVNANNSVDTQVVRASYVLNSLFFGNELYGVSAASASSASGIWVHGTEGASVAVTSVTRTNGVATVTTTDPHGYSTGHVARLAGAAQLDYNTVVQITSTGASTFTFPVTGIPVTPATGTITVKRLYLTEHTAVIDNYIHDIATGVPPQAVYASLTRGLIAAENRIAGGGRGIFFDDANLSGVIANNEVKGCADNGIRINPAAGGTFVHNIGHTVVGNTVDGAGVDGFRFNGVKLTLTGNTARNCAGVGFKADCAQDVTLTGNIADGNGSDGFALIAAGIVELTGAHRNVKFSANHSMNNGGWGYRIDGGGYSGTDIATRIALLGGSAFQNAAGGVSWENADGRIGGDFDCFDNTNGASSSNKNGIYINVAKALTVSLGLAVDHVRCYDTRASGNRQTNGVLVQVTHASGVLTGLIIEDSDVSDSPGYGVRIDPAPTGTLNPVAVRRNMAANCPNGGISVRSSDTGGGNCASKTLTEVSGDRGDASVSLTWGAAERVQRFVSALTANRTITLITTTSGVHVRGDTWRIVRTGLGAFTLTIQDDGANTLKVIPSATAAVVEATWSGAAWILTGYGVL